MAYVDGYVVPVPKSRLEEYRAMSVRSGELWREHGALEYCEFVADDVRPGKLTSFPQSVMLEPDETVVFSWILYESREHRDAVNAKVMNDPRMADIVKPERMPFDDRRMVFGGFQVLVEV